MPESALSLVGRLRAALDRAEEIARAASRPPWTHDYGEVRAAPDEGDWLRETIAGYAGYYEVRTPEVDCTFIAANGPDVVLRTVAAHRKILDEYEAVRDDTPQDLERQSAHAQMLIVVRLLAAVYFPEAPDA